METTRGCIFSVKRTETSLETEWCKVSWCHMTRKTGKGSRWKVYQKKFNQDNKRKRKRTCKTTYPGMYYKEVRDDKEKAICTWVKKTDLPLGMM